MCKEFWKSYFKNGWVLFNIAMVLINVLNLSIYGLQTGPVVMMMVHMLLLVSFIIVVLGKLSEDYILLKEANRMVEDALFKFTSAEEVKKRDFPLTSH